MMSDYWIKKKKEYQKRWEENMSSINIDWLSREEFWKLFEIEKEKYPELKSAELYFDCRLDELRAKIQVPPVFRPFEADFPGPVERWYGKVDDDLFMLTYHYALNGEGNDIWAIEGSEHKIIVELDKLKNIDAYG